MKGATITWALKNILHRKMRSSLTVLSILIGVMAIFALVSFGLGIKNYMDVLAEDMGIDKLFIQAKGAGAPGTDESFYLSEGDINFVRKIKGVSDVAAFYVKVAEITQGKETKYAFAMGYDPADTKLVEEALTVDIEKGRQLKKGDVKKVLLGYNYQFENKYFKKEISIGDKIEINGEKLEVIGFYGQVGNAQDDSNIYMTLEGMESIFDDITGKYGWGLIRADKNEDPEALADKIQEKLRKYKGQEEGKEDFYVQTFADALATFSNIIGILNTILYVIALISLIVAFVNIMNVMYTAVIERTKEIGILKAVGAKNGDIFTIFVFESGFLGMLGGAAGILFGWAIASLGGLIASSAGYPLLTPIFPWYLIAGCLAFAFFVGALAGFLPALQASKQNVADALRYE
ncbi:MAG: ABC transporter permease [Nanoarchaeota archaeon]|nr:ABC transporter permease [Nanoarchaeota archaeon]